MNRILFVLAFLFASTTFAADNPLTCAGANCKIVMKPRNGSSVQTTTANFDGVYGLTVGQGGSSPLYNYSLTVPANSGNQGRGLVVAFGGSNTPMTMGVGLSNGFPYLGINALQTAATDGQTYAVTGNPATRIFQSANLEIQVAPSGTAGNDISWVSSALVSTAGAWTLGPSGANIAHTVNGGSLEVTRTPSNGQTVTAGGSGSSRQGRVGIFKNASSGNPAALLQLDEQDGTVSYLWMDDTSVLRTSTTAGDIGLAAGNVIGAQTSDLRLKSKVRPYEGGLETVAKFKPIRYVMHGKEHVGLGAQDVEKVVPEAVTPPGPGNEYYRLESRDLIPALINSINQLRQRVECLEKHPGENCH